MAETADTADNTQVAEEVKTHDVEYADEEAKQTVSTALKVRDYRPSWVNKATRDGQRWSISERGKVADERVFRMDHSAV